MEKGNLLDYIEGLKVAQGRHAGNPFHLMAWQRRFLRGFLSTSGDCALSVARGNGKTTFISAIGSAFLDGPLHEAETECLIVASSFEQGRIAFEHVLRFLRQRYDLDDRETWRKQDSFNRALLTRQATGATLRVMGSDPRRLHGTAPKLLIYDEVAQWPETQVRKMLAALSTSRGKIADSRAVWIGTRPESPEHPFQQALDGEGTTYQQTHAARRDDPPFQRRTWKRANPGLDHLPDLESIIREESEQAKRGPDALAAFKALRLNQGVSDVTRSVLIDADTWKRNEQPAALTGGQYALGIDCGQNAAMTAAAAYWPETGTLDALACFPETPDLAQRGLADGVGPAYVRMAQRGELIQAGGRVSSIPALLTECLNRWGTPGVIVSDRWREAELRDALDAAGFPVTGLELRGQGFKDGGEDVRVFRKAFAAGYVNPARSLLLRAAMSEARVTGDPAGNWKLAKKTQGGRREAARDDAAAAAILAVAEGERRTKRHDKRTRKRPGIRSAIV